MSKHRFVKVKCPKCGSEIDASVWDSVNVDLDHAEKTKVLNGTFFQVTCQNCNYVSNLDYPCLYHDMAKRIMVQYVSNENEAKKCMEMYEDIQREFDAGLDAYQIRIVLRQRELLEKVRIFDAGYDDRVIGIMKVMLYVMVDEGNKDFHIKDILFENTENGFRLIATSEDQGYASADFTDEMYNDTAEKYADKIESTIPEYFIYDIKWAWSVIQQS